MKYNPSRQIPKNYRNITGKFSTSKGSRLISYESKLERDFLYLFEFDNSIINVFEQPTAFHYIKDNKSSKYTPDFYLVTPPNQKDIVVEIKYYDDLKIEIAQNKEKYKAIISSLKKENIDFQFFTDRCIKISSDNFRFNIHFLLNYTELPYEHYKLAKHHFKTNLRISELLSIITHDRYKQLDYLNSIWCMIRRNIIIVDLFEKLTLDTKLIKIKNYNEEKYYRHLSGKIHKGYLL
jgi:hypothetical protein